MSIVSRQAFIAIALISRMPLSPSGLRQVSPIWSDLNISRNKHPRTLSNFGSSSLRTLGSRRGVPGQKQPSALPIEVSSTMETRTAILVYGAAVDVGIQLVGWALATVLRTETFYDAFGSLSYCALAIGSLAYGGNEHPRQILMTTLVCVWTLRLGTFLLLRALRTGGDSRFDELKHQTCRSFLLTHSSITRISTHYLVSIDGLKSHVYSEVPRSLDLTGGVGVGGLSAFVAAERLPWAWSRNLMDRCNWWLFMGDGFYHRNRGRSSKVGI